MRGRKEVRENELLHLVIIDDGMSSVSNLLIASKYEKWTTNCALHVVGSIRAKSARTSSGGT